MKSQDKKRIAQNFIVLLLLCISIAARGQASFGGFIQTIHFPSETNGVDVVTISNAVPAQAMLVVFETFEAPSTMTSAAMTNSSNYIAAFQGTQMDSSVHRQSIYSMYCPDGLAVGANIGMSYNQPAGSARAYALVYLVGVSSNTQPDALYIGQSYGSTVSSYIATTNPGCVIVGMATSDGVPTNATGSAVSYSTTGVTMIGSADINIGYHLNSTAGLVSAYFFTNAPTAGTYSKVSLWTTNGGTVGTVAKAEETILVAFDPSGVTNSAAAHTAVSTNSVGSTNSGLGAYYYVDYVNGSDSNLGTQSAPWQHCPGDSNAVATAASVVPGPGTTIVFKGGVTYVGSVEINGSGAAENPITYDGNSAGTFGTGMALIDCQSNYYHAFDANHIIKYRNHIVIDNFDISHLKNLNYYQNQWVNTVPYSQDTADTTNLVNYLGVNNVYYYGGVFVYGTDWTIANCNFHETENWWYRSMANNNTTNFIQCQQTGINVYGGTNVLITNCAMWGIGRDCVDILGSNIVVTGCNFGGPTNIPLSNRGWFAVAARIAGGVSNCIVTNCLVHDGWQREGDDAMQRDHAGDWFHLYGNNNGVLDKGDPVGITIANCFLYNDHSFSNACGTADIYLEQDVWNVTISDCIILNPHHMAIWTSGGVISNLNLFNDTIISYSTVNGATMALYLGYTVQGIHCYNNVVANLTHNSAGMPLVVLASTNVSTFSFDNNIFYNPNTLSYGTARYTNLDIQLSTWANLTGLDLHSTNANPLFVNLPTNGASCSLGDYHLTSNSPAISRGVNLSSVFTADFSGVPRLQNWDIGAFQYQTLLLPPTNLRVVSP